MGKPASDRPFGVVHFGLRYLPLTENWIHSQVAGLRNVRTAFYALHGENRDLFPLATVRCLFDDLGEGALLYNRVWFKLFGRYPHFLRWLRRDRPRVIHAHFGPRGWQFLDYAERAGLPLVTSFYGADAYRFPLEDPAWLGRYQELFTRGRLFLAEGPAMRRRLIELGCPPDKVRVHHIGVSLERYQYQARAADGPLRLMVCGRFEEKKGFPIAVAAVARLREQSGREVTLTIVGDADRQGTMTIEKQRIVSAIADAGLGDAVRITGYVPHEELVRLVYLHHVFLAPSIHAADGDAEGGFPVILTEVLGSGMPVVASDHCDIPEIVHDGRWGYIVPQNDPEALAGALERLLAEPQRWAEMGRDGRRHVEENYDIQRLSLELESIYREVAEGGEA
jgi:colanic acid/amylovoran biosynthesis glycosyltransferase